MTSNFSIMTLIGIRIHFPSSRNEPSISTDLGNRVKSAAGFLIHGLNVKTLLASLKKAAHQQYVLLEQRIVLKERMKFQSRFLVPVITMGL